MDAATLLARDRFAAALGARLVVDEPDRVVVEMTVSETHLDESGRVSTGALFALADCAMSLISNAGVTAVAVATHFVRHGTAAVGQVVAAEARPALGSDTSERTWDIPVTAGGACIARFVGTTLTLSR